MSAALPRTELEHALRDLASAAQRHASHHRALAGDAAYTPEGKRKSRGYGDGMARIGRHLLALADREDAGTLPPEAPVVREVAA